MPNTKQRSQKQTKKPLQARRSPNRKGIERAIADLLDAVGAQPSDDTARTPERVARMWLESWIDGEQKTPHELIPKPLHTKSRDIIVVKDIRVHSICPHHLLPYSLTAHVAFIPDGLTAGFSRIADLIEACAHRLILLEDLAQLILEWIDETLKPSGVACLLESRQSCMVYQGRARHENQVTAMAFRGLLETNEKRRAEAMRLLG